MLDFIYPYRTSLAVDRRNRPWNIAGGLIPWLSRLATLTASNNIVVPQKTGFFKLALASLRGQRNDYRSI